MNTTQKQLKDYTIEELKVQAYDNSRALEIINNNLKNIHDAIIAKETEFSSIPKEEIKKQSDNAK